MTLRNYRELVIASCFLLVVAVYVMGWNESLQWWLFRAADCMMVLCVIVYIDHGAVAVRWAHGRVMAWLRAREHRIVHDEAH